MWLERLIYQESVKYPGHPCASQVFISFPQARRMSEFCQILLLLAHNHLLHSQNREV
jgi:hypothetical protein